MDSTEAREPLITGGVVTFLDVLGWRGVYDRQDDAISRLTSLVDGLKKMAITARGNLTQETGVRSISDTIVLYTKCTESDAIKAIDIHGKLATWVIPTSIIAEIPVRGAIAYGDFEFRENIFVGKAVDEAAAWHEYADWIGVHLTPSAEYIFGSSSSSTWIKYRPPHKMAIAWKVNCVNWTAKWSDRNQETAKIVASLRRLGPILPDIAAKFANTLTFIETANSQSPLANATDSADS